MKVLLPNFFLCLLWNVRCVFSLRSKQLLPTYQGVYFDHLKKTYHSINSLVVVAVMILINFFKSIYLYLYRFFVFNRLNCYKQNVLVEFSKYLFKN